MHDILVSHEPPRGRTRLTDWLRTNADTVGRVYASEVSGEELLRAAEMTLRAHLGKLVAEGRVREEGSRYSLR